MTLNSLRIPLLVALALVACESSHDLCPPGYRESLSQGRCVPMEDAPVRAAPTREGSRDEHDEDAKPPAPTPPETEMEDAAVDASHDDAKEPPDASDTHVIDATVEAEASTPIDAGDAGEDASPTGDSGAPVCDEDDARTWAALHLSDALVSTITSCATDTSCQDGDCTLSDCMHEASGIQSCSECAADEGACVATHCSVACTDDSHDARCIECACKNGCIGMFEQCAQTQLDVCNACVPSINYCRGLQPWPAILVPILHPLH